MKWDLFCRVIDNHGDAGVSWRLASELARRGEAVRLWIDDPAPLAFMAPQGAPGVEVVHWSADAPALPPGDVVVEAFGCDPPPAFVARMARASPPPAWINLEYLSAEAWVERSHGLPSPVSTGPGAGLVKQFFFPGFSARTGGLLREQDLAARRSGFDAAAWLARLGIARTEGPLASLFCYEPQALPALLRQLAGSSTQLLVTAGRAAAAVRAALGQLPARRPRLHFLPLLSQRDYDHLLWACDLNFVRGEDSVVRGLLAGKPCVWQIYPQDDGAHGPKLEAWLRWLQAPPALARFHRVWNGLEAGPLPVPDPAGWAATAEAAAARIAALPELTAELGRFAASRVRI